MGLIKVKGLESVAAAPEAATAGFSFNHTMLRVKDIDKSLDFYTRVLGFSLVETKDFPDAAFSLYFLALVDPAVIPKEEAECRRWVKSVPGVLELTYNYGSESDDKVVYHNGNSEPRGFGHICVSVPDIKAACARFEELGVPFQKRLTDGRMREIAFIKDPDTYWVEIIQPTPLD